MKKNILLCSIIFLCSAGCNDREINVKEKAAKLPLKHELGNPWEKVDTVWMADSSYLIFHSAQDTSKIDSIVFRQLKDIEESKQ